MTHEIENWIEEAAGSAGLPVERLPDDMAAEIQQRAMAKFVVDNPRAWWMSLARPYEQFDSKKTSLSDVLPDGTGRCWLIPETESARLPVYGVDRTRLSELLGKCPYFEYYVVGADLSWLVAESDHNVFFVCRT